MFKRIDHVEIITGDMEGSVSFYTDVLSFRLKERWKVETPNSLFKEVAYLQLGDTVLEILAAGQPAPASAGPSQVGYRMMAIEVEDMDKAIAYLRSKKVELSQPPRPIGKSRRAQINDPNGLPIELRQW